MAVVSLALYVIGSTFLVLLLSARLRDAQAELARLRAQCDARAEAVRAEYAAYAHGTAMTLACLLAGVAAMHWHATARPAPGSGHQAAADRAGAAGKEAGG